MEDDVEEDVEMDDEEADDRVPTLSKEVLKKWQKALLEVCRLLAYDVNNSHQPVWFSNAL